MSDDITPERFHALYEENRTPWDIGRADPNLERLVATGRIAPTTAAVSTPRGTTRP